MPVRDDEVDSLASLEERIHRTVELIQGLRAEKDTAQRERDEARSQVDGARQEALVALDRARKAVQELDELKNERKHVRTRIEKLLGQMDLLGNA